MTVANILLELEKLKNEENNLKKLRDYFLDNPDISEEIAEEKEINSPLHFLLAQVETEVNNRIQYLQKILNKTNIELD